MIQNVTTGLRKICSKMRSYFRALNIMLSEGHDVIGSKIRAQNLWSVPQQSCAVTADFDFRDFVNVAAVTLTEDIVILL